eukprot:TRINITY_DN66982_c0_g1_i1.p1 TRINITY_DN66982_c0_g1~~TRINITY_DN66982_c0_g1_i1.p1  ORF type:complete len:314 (+),score=69.41 TRINITY_DN66982_c0_g1_i1:115-942(+)
MGAHCCGYNRKEDDFQDPLVNSPPPLSFRELRLDKEGAGNLNAKQVPAVVLAAAKRPEADDEVLQAPRGAVPSKPLILQQPAPQQPLDDGGSTALHAPRQRRSTGPREAAPRQWQPPPLNEEGYLVARHSKEAMIDFVQRLLASLGGRAQGPTAEAEMKGVAQWHSSGHALATFSLLKEELQRAPWAAVPHISPRLQNGLGMAGALFQDKPRSLSSWYNEAPKDEEEDEDAQPSTLTAWYLGGEDRPDTSQAGVTQQYEIGSYMQPRRSSGAGRP